MSTIAELLVALGINTGPFTAGLAKAQGELRGFATEADVTGRRASGSLNGIGIAAAGIAGGVAIIGASAIKSASAFQASMTLVQTQAGASAAEVTKMSAAVLELAPAVGIGPEQLSAGLYHIESAGIRGAKALDVLKIAAEGAKVGNADLESVTNALVAEVNSGVGGVQNMSQAMGVLNAIVGSGNMRMQDLTDAMTTGVLSAAKTFGVSIQSVGAAIATMTNAGIPAVDAATKLNSAMRLMAAPSSKAAAELKTIGLSSTKLAADLRTPGGILTAIRDLQTHLTNAGLTATQQAALLATAFGGKQSLGILTLIGSLSKLGVIQKQVAAGAGTFDAAWKATEATTKEQGAQIDASISTVKDAIGIGLLPAINNLLHSVLPMVQGLATWAAANPGLASRILLVTGAVAALVAGVVFLGPILGAIGGVIATITSPILLVIGAIVGLAAHFGLLGKGAKDAVDGLASAILGAIPGVISMFQNLAAQFVAWVGPMIPRVIAALGSLASQAIAWVSAQAPIFLAQLLSWADVFVGWIGPMIPVALAALGDLGASLVRWVLDEIPILAAGIGMLAGELVNWVLPKIPGLLADLGQFGLSLINWIATEATVVAGAMADLAIAAVGALGSALVSDPSLIAKGIGLLLAGVLVVAAAQAAATVVGTVYTVAMKIAATAAGAIGAFASAIAAAILTQLTTMAAAGGVVGTAIGAAMKVGALAAEGFGNIATAIAGVIGEGTPVVAAAAATQGTVAGAAGAVSFAAALTAGMVAAAAAAVVAVWAIINDGLNKQVAAIQSRLNEVIGAQTLAQLNQDKLAIGQGIASILNMPFGSVLYGDQLKSLRDQLAQVQAQIDQVNASATDSRLPIAKVVPKLVAVPDKAPPKLVAVPDYAENAAAAAAATAAKAQAVALATAIAQANSAAAAAAAKATGIPGAAAVASAPVVAATSAAAQATTAAQIHLESMRVQLQTAELAANAGDAAASQQVLVLKAEIAHQQAADAVAAAQRAVTVAETVVKASHDKLVLAQEGRIKGLNIVTTSEAAYKLAQDKLALATAKLTLAQGNAALQAQTAVAKAAAVPPGILEPAGGVIGAAGAAMVGGTVPAPFMGTTVGITEATPTGTNASGAALDRTAIAALASAIRAWLSNGVPLTLDGQTVGDLIDRHAYTSASMATSGFVVQGSIG